jgi:hypothetical protein
MTIKQVLLTGTAALASLTVLPLAQAQSPGGNAVPVTADNFVRAETDMYFGVFVKRSGPGTFYHFRELPPIDGPGVRPNRDTLY